jgi:hypothetical protein
VEVFKLFPAIMNLISLFVSVRGTANSSGLSWPPLSASDDGSSLRRFIEILKRGLASSLAKTFPSAHYADNLKERENSPRHARKRTRNSEVET